MEQEKNKNGVIILLVAFIIILTILCVLFATNTISFNSNSVNNSNQSNGEAIENNNETDITNSAEQNENSNSKYAIKSMTNAKFNIFWDNTEHEIKISDGKLVVEGNVFSITNERIKYFYFNSYQCGHGTVLYYLTESGNVYVTNMSANENNLKMESLNNFKKLNYSNVTDIVVIQNDNYGKALDDVSGMTDNVKEYLYALVNGETFKLDYQYAC